MVFLPAGQGGAAAFFYTFGSAWAADLFSSMPGFYFGIGLAAQRSAQIWSWIGIVAIHLSALMSFGQVLGNGKVVGSHIK